MLDQWIEQASEPNKEAIIKALLGAKEAMLGIRYRMSQMGEAAGVPVSSWTNWALIFMVHMMAILIIQIYLGGIYITLVLFSFCFFFFGLKFSDGGGIISGGDNDGDNDIDADGGGGGGTKWCWYGCDDIDDDCNDDDNNDDKGGGDNDSWH